MSPIFKSVLCTQGEFQVVCTNTVRNIYFPVVYYNCAFQNHTNSEVQKPKLTFAFFTSVYHLSGPLR